MTAMSSQTAPRSRRALLAGALGGLGAWAASAAARVDPAAAAAGDPIRMGRVNRSGGTQTVLQTNNSGAGFEVRQASAGPAIRGEATSGRAVVGVAGRNGTGVWGDSPNHVGVRATSKSGPALVAVADSGFGMFVQTDTGRSALFVENLHGAEAISAMADNGIALHAWAFRNGWAAVFTGRVRFENRVTFEGWQDLSEIREPPAPAIPNTARLFAKDNGSGKTQLCVRFPTGAVQVLATEP
jgi:hypothetical protein